MRRLLCLALGLILLFSIGAIGITADDSGEEGESLSYAIGNTNILISSAENEADILHTLGLFYGTDNGYELEKPVTRAEAITMVLRMIGEDREAAVSTSIKEFSDVLPEHWAYTFIGYAADKGYINGTSETTFEPNRTVTGQEFVKMLLTAFGYPEIYLDTAYEAGIKFSLLVNNYTKAIASTEGYFLLRNDVVNLCYSALLARMPDGKSFLKDVLIDKGAFSEEELNRLIIDEDNTPSQSFAWQLKELMPQDENYMFSPLSIKMALAMAAVGAQGDTQDEILKTLQINDLEEFNQFSKKLIEEYAENEKAKLAIANSLWLNTDYAPGVDFSKEFSSIINEFYNADSDKVNNQDAVDTINSWVYDKTNGKIESLISDPEFLAYIINAIYFKGEWASQFSEGATQKSEFTDRKGVETQIDFMNKTGYFDYYGEGSLQMIKLPYSDKKTSMYVVLSPNREGDIDKNIEKMKSTRVQLSLPKFKTEFEIGLIDALSKLGIQTAFDKNRADLKKMFTDMSENAFITNVVHKTFINVDENGTEAAAVTGIGIGLTSMPTDPPIEFNADRPFTYFIRDDVNGEILFLGEYAFAD